MDPLLLSAGISAGGNILGGLMSRSRSGDRAHDREMFGYQVDAERAAFRRNRDEGRHMARNSLRYRVADARRAGIHPLAALGAQLNTFSPIQGGGGSISSSNTGDGRADAVRAASMQIAQMVADKKESDSRTKLNLAQAAALDAERKLKNPGAPPNPQPPGLAEMPGHDIKNPQFTKHYKFGLPLRHAPLFSDAETLENIHGDNELASTITWMLGLPADVSYTGVHKMYEVVKDLLSKSYKGSDINFGNKRYLIGD